MVAPLPVLYFVGDSISIDYHDALAAGCSGRDLIWITTTQVDEKHHNSRSSFHRYEADLAAYNAVAKAVMDTQNVPQIDLHDFTRTLGEPLLRDHVHFHPSVSVQQATFILRELDRILPGRPPA